MSRTVKKVLREEYNRLKKAMERIIKPKKQDSQLVLQPVRNQQPKKYLRGTHLP